MQIPEALNNARLPIPGLVGRWLTGRRGLALIGLAAVAAGLMLGWNWLSAIGVAPVILSLAPCAAMCALGLCMNKMMGERQSGANGAPSPSGIPPAAPKAEIDPT